MTAELIYFATRSLDGYIEDAQGKLDFATQEEASQQFVNDALRPTGTYLYGRRMYETMLNGVSEGRDVTFVGRDPAHS